MTYSLEEAKYHVRATALELKKEGLIVRTWGNVSARVDENTFVITPTGRDFEGMTNEDIVTVNIKDGSYEAGKHPSSEYLIHLVTYKVNPEARFIIHTHQPVASAISTLGVDFTDIRQYIPEGMTRDVHILGNTIPTTPYEMNGTKDMMKSIGRTWKKNKFATALLMKNHGALCWGADDKEAFFVTKMLEKMSRWIYASILETPEEDFEFDNIYDTKYREKLRWSASIKEMQGCYSFVSRSPFLVRYSNLGKDLEAYLDDMAQIAGPSIKNIVGSTNQKELASALKNAPAVLLKGKGAVCISNNEDEARFLCMVLEKTAMAAYFAKKNGYASPIPDKIANEYRRNYLEKYSKLI